MEENNYELNTEKNQNNINNPDKKKNIIIIILIIVVITLLLALIYVSIDKEKNNDNKSNNENQTTNNNQNTDNNNNNDPQEENKATEIDIQNKIVTELYNTIIPSGYIIDENLEYHKQNKILAKNINNSIKLELTSQLWYKNYQKNPSKDVIVSNYGDNLSVPKKQFEDIYHKLFGKDDTLKVEQTYNTCPGINPDSNNRVKLLMACGGDGPRTIAQKVYKAEKTKDELYIYEKAGFLDVNYKTSMEKGEETVVLDGYKLYKDYSKKILVATLNTTNLDIPNIDKYYDELDTFKYTFKLNADNTYYFYSVEKLS